MVAAGGGSGPGWTSGQGLTSCVIRSRATLLRVSFLHRQNRADRRAAERRNENTWKCLISGKAKPCKYKVLKLKGISPSLV